MTSSPKAPPGWYPDPEGNQRFWDGDNWLEIPPPELDAKTATENPKAKRRRILVVIAVVFALIVVAGGSGAYILKTRADEQAAAVAAQEAREREEKAAAEATAEAEAIAEADAVREERRAAARLRKERKGAITTIEASIAEMAQGLVDKGFIDGSIIAVRCTPVQGATPEPLLEDSTVFDCFVSTQQFDDGRQEGYPYNAIMNWTTNNYTFGIGEP